MTIDEMKNKISMELKSPATQQGFEIICKHLVELERENADLRTVRDARAKCMSEDKDALEKAREIIGELLEFMDGLGNFSGGVFDRARQFIKGAE